MSSETALVGRDAGGGRSWTPTPRWVRVAPCAVVHAHHLCMYLCVVGVCVGVGVSPVQRKG